MPLSLHYHVKHRPATPFGDCEVVPLFQLARKIDTCIGTKGDYDPHLQVLWPTPEVVP
jgi:hypothetical protein